jgi:TetR/AcrR family transcriptional regulator
MPTRRGRESREKILSTAKRLFSEHGFDKTTVDSIAAEAGVNKALIYYHFDSKDEIVKTIYDRILDEIERIGDNAGENLHDQLMAELSGTGNFAPGMAIMLMDALKTGGGSNTLIQFGLTIIEKEHPEFKKLPAAEYRKAVLSLFFTGFIPFLMFSVLKERWAKYNGTDLKETEEQFVKIFIEKHLDGR